MSSMFSRKTMVLIQAVSIVLFALVAAVIPQYAFMVFLLYFIVFMAIAMRATSRTMKAPPKSELGAPVFKEANTAQAMLSDKMLTVEMSKQVRFLFINIGLIFLLFLLLPIYNSYLWPLIEGYMGSISDGILVNFIRYLGMYLFFIGVMQGLRYVLMRGQQSMQPMIFARSFSVYRKGVLLDDRQFIPFSQELCFSANPDRKFVELRNTRSKTAVTRLYTLEVGKLVDKLREVGLVECTA